MANDKWYNSKFFTHLGEGLGIAAFCLGVGYGTRACDGPSQREIAFEKARTQVPVMSYPIPKLQTADINGNGVSDKFYIIDGKVAAVELDGKPVTNSLENKVLQK